ncbi:MAG: PaaI family thioesterase [Amphiplicatus sp.]
MSADVPIRPAPEGWFVQNHLETFSGHAGPFYFREPGPASGVGFFSEPRHANLADIVHGGALLTLADMSLFDICFRAAGGRFKAVTVSLNCEFLSAGPIGEFIEASGEMTRGGKSLMFARGLITAAGKPLMSFSGILKRLD